VTALLFIHAFPLDGSMWDEQVRALADAASPILAPSLPGFGGAPVPPVQPTMDDYSDAIARALDEAGIRRAAVCGLSMGGYVAFALLRRRPDLVSGLVLAGTRAEPDDAAARQRRHEVAERVREGGTAALLASPPPLLRPGAPAWDLVRGTIGAQPPEAIAQASLAMAARPDSRGDLEGIAIPTAVVVGAEDMAIPVEHSRYMAQRIPGATLTVVPDAGHLVNLEAPAPFESAVRDLLKRVPPG
jgi:3-oxoadipate enol-lactonase